jgi:hypothetical protein
LGFATLAAGAFPYTAAAAAAACLQGIDAFTLLQYGLPAYFQDLLLAVFRAWDTTLWGVALAAAALPVTAWAVRCWWSANMQLLAGKDGAVQQMQQMMEQQDQQASCSSSSSAWVAGVVGIARALLISSAVGSFTSALSSSSITEGAVAAVSGLATAAAAAAPVALQLTNQRNSSGSKGSTSYKAVAVQLLALEAAWTAAMVGVAPLLNFAAAAGVAATLLTLHKQVVAPRLLQYQAAAGDSFQAHVSLKLPGSSVAFDTTLSGEPVALVAGQRSAEHAQNWQQLGSDAFWEELAAKGSSKDAAQSPADSAAAPAAAGEAGSSSAAAAAVQLRSISQGLRGWLGTPAARWEPLLPFVADAACGMIVGESRTVHLFNPKAGGYWNPSYSWWQPTADVMSKFRGQVGIRAEHGS